jgi:uncharacterized protein (DUF58 family)
LRQFEEERDAFVHVLLDVTGSMSRGAPTKIEIARKISAAFAYVGTRQFDRVRVLAFADEVDPAPLAVRGPQDLPELERMLEATDAAGPTAFAEATRQIASRGLKRGLLVVVSDLMSPDGWDEGFRLLGSLGHELRVVRVGCKEDLAPDFSGELELRDSETDERVRLRVSNDVLKRYREEVKKHLENCRDTVRRAGGRWIEVDVEMPIELVMKRVFAGPQLRTAAGAR